MKDKSKCVVDGEQIPKWAAKRGEAFCSIRCEHRQAREQLDQAIEGLDGWKPEAGRDPKLPSRILVDPEGRRVVAFIKGDSRGDHRIELTPSWPSTRNPGGGTYIACPLGYDEAAPRTTFAAKRGADGLRGSLRRLVEKSSGLWERAEELLAQYVEGVDARSWGLAQILEVPGCHVVDEESGTFRVLDGAARVWGSGAVDSGQEVSLELRALSIDQARAVLALLGGD